MSFTTHLVQCMRDVARDLLIGEVIRHTGILNSLTKERGSGINNLKSEVRVEVLYRRVSCEVK